MHSFTFPFARISFVQGQKCGTLVETCRLHCRVLLSFLPLVAALFCDAAPLNPFVRVSLGRRADTEEEFVKRRYLDFCLKSAD